MRVAIDSIRSSSTGLLSLSVALLLAGCGDDPGKSAEATQATPGAGKTLTYNWYMDGGTPAGQSVTAYTGDGRISSESFVHWNNREYTVNSELQLDNESHVVAQTITGTSPFGAKIDESFSYVDGVARWSTVGERGSVDTDEAAFYVPVEFGAVASLAALVRAGADRLDGEIPLFPSGSGRVEALTTVEVQAANGNEKVTLFGISGIGFTPIYVWLNDDMELVARDFGGYLGMIPEGWNPATLAELSAIQSAQDAEYIARQAGELARTLDQALLIENVDVVDVASGELLEGRHVLVRAGKIAAVSEAALDVPGALRVDGSGQSLLPGLWDMHGHFGLADGILNVAGGITSVRDVGGVHDKVLELTKKFDSGEVIGPHTYRAGFIDRAGPYASGWAAESLDDALERVDFFAQHGYIQIKLYSSIEPAWVEPIAKHAHAHGMRLSGHVPAYMSAEQAVRAGYDEIQHINMVFLNFLAGDREDTRQQIRFTLYGEKAGELDLEGPEVQAFIALLKENQVVVDPTAAIFDTMLRHMPGEPDPTFASIIDHLPNAVRRPMYNPAMDNAAESVEVWGKSAVAQAAMLRKLYESGIQLVPGSDGIPGFTLLRELEVYAEAGIPIAAVLKMATLDSARVVGVDDRTGSISVGKDADLVLVQGNPLLDISAVRRATLVLKGNTLYRPDELYRSVGVTPFVKSAAAM